MDKSQIREHMKVVGSDGRSIGSVDKVEGDKIKANEGSYTLEDQGDGTTLVTYHLEVDLKFPVPGFIKQRAAPIAPLERLGKRREGADQRTRGEESPISGDAAHARRNERSTPPIDAVDA